MIFLCLCSTNVCNSFSSPGFVKILFVIFKKADDNVELYLTLIFCQVDFDISQIHYVACFFCKNLLLLYILDFVFFNGKFHGVIQDFCRFYFLVFLLRGACLSSILLKAVKNMLKDLGLILRFGFSK